MYLVDRVIAAWAAATTVLLGLSALEDKLFRLLLL